MLLHEVPGWPGGKGMAAGFCIALSKKSNDRDSEHEHE